MLLHKGFGGARGGVKSVTSSVAFDRVHERRKSYVAAREVAATPDAPRVGMSGIARRGSIAGARQEPLATPGALPPPGGASANGGRRGSNFACSMFTHEASRVLSAGERAVIAREAAEDRDVNEAVDQVDRASHALHASHASLRHMRHTRSVRHAHHVRHTPRVRHVCHVRYMVQEAVVLAPHPPLLTAFRWASVGRRPERCSRRSQVEALQRSMLAQKREAGGHVAAAEEWQLVRGSVRQLLTPPAAPTASYGPSCCTYCPLLPLLLHLLAHPTYPGRPSHMDSTQPGLGFPPGPRSRPLPQV